jgi:hypothetical protein
MLDPDKELREAMSAAQSLKRVYEEAVAQLKQLQGQDIPESKFEELNAAFALLRAEADGANARLARSLEIWRASKSDPPASKPQ